MDVALGFIGIVTTDLAASLAFYRDLGIELPPVAEDEDHVQTTLSNGVVLAWDTAALITSLDPGYTTPQGGHRIALAFNLGSPAAVDAAYQAMITAGHRGKVAPWDAFWGQRYATLVDPDGNAIDIYAALTS